jgi:hypothetical protein
MQGLEDGENSSVGSTQRPVIGGLHKSPCRRDVWMVESCGVAKKQLRGPIARQAQGYSARTCDECRSALGTTPVRISDWPAAWPTPNETSEDLHSP